MNSKSAGVNIKIRIIIGRACGLFERRQSLSSLQDKEASRAHVSSIFDESRWEAMFRQPQKVVCLLRRFGSSMFTSYNNIN